MQLAAQLSGQVCEDQSTKYVLKDQPDIVSNIHRTLNHNQSQLTSLRQQLPHSTEENMGNKLSERLMEATVAAIGCCYSAETKLAVLLQILRLVLTVLQSVDSRRSQQSERRRG